MIVFRQVDPRYPFLWETPAQRPGRWHDSGEGPAHYFADTPDGAWAELLRHEEITTLEDLATVRRQMWAIDIGDTPAGISGPAVEVAREVATGGFDTYPACQAEARRLRAQGARRLVAPSAALKPGAARGMIVQQGTHEAPPRDGLVVVVFGAPAALVGWIAAAAARPSDDLLERVNHYPLSQVAPQVDRHP